MLVHCRFKAPDQFAAYLVAAPLLLAVLWNLYQALSALLPNVY